MRIFELTETERIACSLGEPESGFNRAGSDGNNVKKGNWAEDVAAKWLRGLGYEVFRNVHNTGPIDLIAIKEDRVRKIDVKLLKQVEYTAFVGGRRIGVFGKPLTKIQKEQGVEHLYVTHDGFCAFSKRVVRNYLMEKAGMPATSTKVGRRPKLNI